MSVKRSFLVAKTTTDFVIITSIGTEQHLLQPVIVLYVGSAPLRSPSPLYICVGALGLWEAPERRCAGSSHVPEHGAARSERALYRSLARSFLARRSSRCRWARTHAEPLQRSMMLKEKRPGTYSAFQKRK